MDWSGKVSLAVVLYELLWPVRESLVTVCPGESEVPYGCFRDRTVPDRYALFRRVPDRLE